MKKIVKLVLPAFILLSLAGLIFLVVLYYRTTSTNELTFTEDKDVGVKIEDLSYANTRDGRTIWKLKAKNATSFKSKELMILKGVRLAFYPEDGGTFNMRARDGKFNEAKKVVFASGDVVVSSPTGFTLKTEHLRYDTDAGRITSADPVFISQGQMNVRGVGFKVDVESGNLYILRDVRAVISVRGLDG